MQELERLALKLETESMISASYVRDGEDEYHQGQCDAYQRAAEIVREWANGQEPRMVASWTWR
jgi:hypothetical protein